MGEEENKVISSRQPLSDCTGGACPLASAEQCCCTGAEQQFQPPCALLLLSGPATCPVWT